MKINLPVTQIEKPFPQGKYLVSKTDLKGSITYANEAFVEISGYERTELIGKNHNLVRHPDMPPQAFENLWDTVKKGLPWRGVVKNRSKDGGYYWVEAFVVPIKKNDETIGYMSVRSMPTKDQVRQAEGLYRRLNETKSKLDSGGSWLKRLSIRARLIITMTFMALMLAGGAMVGMGGIVMTNRAMESTYVNRLEPVDMLWNITVLMSDNRAQIMLGLQHAADNAFAKMHDHPLTRHADEIVKNRDEITALWQEYLKRDLAPEERTLADRYYETRMRYVNEGLVPAREALLAGDYAKANEILLTKINPLYKEAYTQVGELLQQTKLTAKNDYLASVSRYDILRNLGIFGTLAGILAVALSGVFLIKAIVHPMRRAIRHFDHISQGNLTDDIDISGRDETGQVLSALAAMQVHLKVLLDEIMVASRSIDQRSGDLQIEMIEVVAKSELQHDRVQSTAAATEEFSQSVKEVADSAEGTARAAVNSQSTVDASHRNMDMSMAATTRVVEAVQASSGTITELNQAILKIGDITQVIKEIADQTNLLALNAAIEAARAGETGRGFAVVADEVRKLAERTANSTADISAMVAEIQNVTQQAVSSMNRAAIEVEEGISLMRASGESLNQITASSQEVTGMAQHIASAAQQQAAASEEVANNMEQISTLIENNLTSAQQAKLATDQLQQTAAELDKLVAYFEIYAKR